MAGRLSFTHPMSQSLAQLREEYLSLINKQLPTQAKQGGFPVRFNHCFARIVLDNLFENCWYQHLSRQEAAYKQLSEAQLKAAIALAQSMLNSPETAQILNQNSLRWRKKRS